MKASPKVLLALLAFLVVTEVHAMRWYSPSTGRWFSRDPIGERGGKNLYAFVGNDPVNLADAHGLVVWTNGPTVETRSTTVQGWPFGTTGTWEFTAGAQAVTLPRISITVTCTKGCPSSPVPWGAFFKWGLQTVNIEYHSEVYLRPSYPSPSFETTVRNLENDHVNDFTTWGNSVGKTLADQTESQFASTYWLSKSSCESAVAKAMREALHPSLEKAIDDTKAKWDATGLHSIAAP